MKIVWTLAAEPAGPGESWFVTRTRAAATDAESRKKFRRYWAPMSAGIMLIRYAGLPLVRKQAQRQARQADEADSQTVTSLNDYVRFLSWQRQEDKKRRSDGTSAWP